jgi:chemotaxis protein methyltransferase CheR
VSTREAIDDYTAFCLGVRDLTGIDLLKYKRNQMERRLRTFSDQRGHATLADFLSLIARDKTELGAFLDRMTINVSQLWRNPEQWAQLEAVLLPELGTGGRIRAWSAGASYGAEAYTLAAVCRTAVPRARTTILGTDISAEMIERCRAGRFSEDDARDAPRAQLERWFERVENGWQARQELISMMRFEQGDLLRIQPAPDSLDLVLCRNTVIYFDEAVRDELHAKLAGALRPGGYLIVGNTERVGRPADLGLAQALPFIYRKA